MSTSKHPVLCVTCMSVICTAARSLKSSKRALNLAYSNGLLRESGDELVSISEERQNKRDDEDEIAWLQDENLRLRRENENLRVQLVAVGLEPHHQDKTVD